ncbi:MAG: hypothetical protein QGF69_04515 [Candidatus Marinimicrobia bacterium]|nr:hypothetical protein [Candidatus Neomarinimicrobiota bacterium]
MIRQLILITILFVSFITAQIPDGLLPMIQKDDLLSEGGADLIKWNLDSTFIVGVSAVEVKKKRKSILRRVGTSKAKAQVTQFIEGSDLTTSRKMETQEKIEIVNNEEIITFTESYLEIIQEDTEGFVRGMSNVGGWYSDDKSMYYYAVARLLPQKKKK